MIVVSLVLAAAPALAIPVPAETTAELVDPSSPGSAATTPPVPSIAAGYLPIGIELVPPDMRDALPMPIGISASFST